MLVNDIDNPVASKAAFGLRSLMPSRVCMTKYFQEDGLTLSGRVLDTLLGRDKVDMTTPSVHREIVEHVAGCYREIGRFYPWRVVKAGGLRHCIILLRLGDILLKTLAAGTLATLSLDLDICKQMFTFGAIKPLINAGDRDNTNEACVLSCLGCIVQLCRIPEIGKRIIQQGALPVLEKALHMGRCHSFKSIREKSLYSLAWLTCIPEIRDKLATPLVLKGEFFVVFSEPFCTVNILVVVVMVMMTIRSEKRASFRDDAFAIYSCADAAQFTQSLSTAAQIYEECHRFYN